MGNLAIIKGDGMGRIKKRYVKFGEEEVRMILVMRLYGFSNREIGRKYGVSDKRVSAVIGGNLRGLERIRL